MPLQVSVVMFEFFESRRKPLNPDYTLITSYAIIRIKYKKNRVYFTK